MYAWIYQKIIIYRIVYIYFPENVNFLIFYLFFIYSFIYLFIHYLFIHLHFGMDGVFFHVWWFSKPRSGNYKSWLMKCRCNVYENPLPPFHCSYLQENHVLLTGLNFISKMILDSLSHISRVSNSYDQPQLPPTKMATAKNGETKQSRISGKPDRALWPYDTDTSVSYHTMYFSYDHVF